MIISTASWGWPQYVVALWLMIGLLLSIGQHGAPKKGYNNAFITLTAFFMWLVILSLGGFFK